MKSLIILAAATLVAAAANAQATTPPSITELEGDYIIINNRTYEEVPAVYNMRPMTITADGDSLVISNMYMTGCLDIKAGYDETTGDITFPSGKLIFRVGDFVYYLYQWNDDQEAVNPRPFTYRYTGDGEWSTDATLMLMAGYAGSEELQPGYFAQGSQIISANATSSNVSYAASGLDRYDESRPSLVRIDDTVITIYNFLQTDQYGYGCMMQGVIDNTGTYAIFVPSTVGQANDLTYRILAGCTLNADGNLPTGLSSAMGHDGYTHATIDLDEGTIVFDPMAIWAGDYDDTTGNLTINSNLVYETVASSSVTFDPDRAYTSSVTTTTADTGGTAEVERVDYYRIDGTLTAQPREGELVIRRTLYKDGTVTSDKMFWH